MRRRGTWASASARAGRGLIGAVAGLCLFGLQQAPAADLVPLSPAPGSLHKCTLELRGVIAAGDAERFGGALEWGKTVVCLSSPGGSYPEGVRIALLFWENGIGTEVRAGASCLSACAIAFMGGTTMIESEIGPFPHRNLHKDAKLGFHAPFLDLREGNFNRAAVLSAYHAALEAIGLLLDNRDRLTIHPELIEAMLKKGSDEFEYIDTIDEAGLYKIGLFGYGILSYPRAMGAACWNASLWKRKAISAQPDEGDGFDAAYENQFKAADYVTSGNANVAVGQLYTNYCEVKLAAETSDAEFYKDYTRGFDGLVTKIRFYDLVREAEEFKISLAPEPLTLEFPAWVILPAATRIADLPPGRYHDSSFVFP